MTMLAVVNALCILVAVWLLADGKLIRGNLANIGAALTGGFLMAQFPELLPLLGLNTILGLRSAYILLERYKK